MIHYGIRQRNGDWLAFDEQIFFTTSLAVAQAQLDLCMRSGRCNVYSKISAFVDPAPPAEVIPDTCNDY